MRLALDTNAYSALMVRDADATNQVSLAERVYLPITVIGELLSGFVLGTKEADNRRHLEQFLAAHSVSIAGIDFEVCEVYARIMEQLRSAGHPIPSNDLWIAAIAVRNGFVLMTADSHFNHVAGLTLSRWK